MKAEILSGSKKPGKTKVHDLTVKSATNRARKSGRATNHNEVDGRKWRRDHPATTHEHDKPKTKQ